ncbi:MAG: glycosyltransferase [Thermoplasmata archaeon]
MEVQPNLLEKAVLPSVTVLIPAYNEESRIRGVLNELADYIRESGADWNVIVSIDGSDGTEGIVREMSVDNPFIMYDKSNTRSGKGYTIKRVVGRSTKD